MRRSNYLWYSGHAYGIGANKPEKASFSSRLHTRASHPHVYTLMYLQTLFECCRLS